MSKMRPVAAALSAAVGLALLAPAAFAGSYPTQICVSGKLGSAAKQCQSDLKAWSKWETSQDNAARDAALLANAAKLATAWTKAETKATAKAVECVETTSTAAEMSTALGAAISDIVTTINTGLSLGNPDDAKCGAALIKAASKECSGFLKAESKFINKLAKDAQGTGRAAARTKASTKFMTAFTAAATGCTPTATAGGIETKIDDLTTSAVTDTTTSPDFATAWTPIDPSYSPGIPYEGRVLHPICSRQTPYEYFVKRGTGDDARKLLVYYQGGGACWDGTTCATQTGAFDDDVTPGDNPANTTTGFGNLLNPDNPFRNWSAVFISYCTGDIHWGDNAVNYTGLFGNVPIQHRGFVNAKVVEKWAREHFVNPDEVFVTGSSAGAYGAILHGIYLHEVFPASKFNVVGDAGNGVITQSFLTHDIQHWNIQPNIPAFITGLNADVTTLTIADLYGRAAAFYAARGSRFAQYTSAWDGGGGSQTFFYNVMVNGILDNGNWWHSSCSWNSQMRANDLDALAEAPANYRYYIGPGSRHTIYGSNRVYTETHGGVPTFVDWLDDMRNDTNPWNNVECTDCSLLGSCAAGANAGASCQHDSECPTSTCSPIDTRPSPLAPPFELGDGYVNCPTPTPTSTP